MLDWIKRIKSPLPQVEVVESHAATPEKDERLERLLIRLGSDRTIGAMDSVQTEADTKLDERAGGDSSNGSAQTSVAAEIGPAIDKDPARYDASAIDAELAAEIRAAIDSLDSEVSADDRLAADDEAETDTSLETGAILGTAADAEAKASVEPAATLLTTRRSAVRAGAATSPMRIIAVCSQKGGSGKTTIAGHLAVQAGLAGHGPAVLIDTDPQGSLAEWWRVRKDDAPALAKVRLEELEDNLDELRSYGTTVAIIDTPPALTGSIQQVMSVADLVVIPARPSPHDLRAVGATVEMAKKAGKPFLFVLNGAAQRANITVQAVAALSEHGRVSPVILYQRTEYAASMIDGRTVIEAAPSGKSAQEIAELWKFVYAQVGMRAAA